MVTLTHVSQPSRCITADSAGPRICGILLQLSGFTIIFYLFDADNYNDNANDYVLSKKNDSILVIFCYYLALINRYVCTCLLHLYS